MLDLVGSVGLSEMEALRPGGRTGCSGGFVGLPIEHKEHWIASTADHICNAAKPTGSGLWKGRQHLKANLRFAVEGFKVAGKRF